MMRSVLREPFPNPCFACPFRHPSKQYNFTNEELTKLAAGDFPCHVTRKPHPVVDYTGTIIAVQMLPADYSRECAGAQFFKEKGVRYRNNA